jgi:hypothetical protein
MQLSKLSKELLVLLSINVDHVPSLHCELNLHRDLLTYEIAELIRTFALQSEWVARQPGGRRNEPKYLAGGEKFDNLALIK